MEDLIITSLNLTPNGGGLVRVEIVDQEIKIYNDVDKNSVYNPAVDQFLE